MWKTEKKEKKKIKKEKNNSKKRWKIKLNTQINFLNFYLFKSIFVLKKKFKQNKN